jgi:hypothetical protein
MNSFDGAPEPAWRGSSVLVLSPTPTHPQDYGNRKRIYTVCSNLRHRGARIVFLHYPAEAEWRLRIPVAAEAEMVRAWHRYYLLPVTRELHPSAAGAHHTIDEWWDDSIGAFLKWLFSVDTFDVFIVNYTWLSKAFEFVPPSVVKILDTHDRFAGRKELLQRHGIEPEFFYTTENEEAVALERADIVWAIKDEERVQFEGIASLPVVTMPHLDESKSFPVPSPDPDGYLRVGIIGARNNVNLTNLRAFLKEALPIFERYFAPIKLVLAGTICNAMRDVDGRFMTLMGEVGDVAEFYGAIDVACIPMAFSTGLKIKAGEAISRDFPVVSLAHAFEGFPPNHPFHSLQDFKEMAEKLVDLSFERSQLADLREASIRTRETAEHAVDSNLRKTWDLVRDRRKYILYCVDARALSRMGALRAVLDSATQYLDTLSELVVAVVSGPLDRIDKNILTHGKKNKIVICENIVRDKTMFVELQNHGFEVSRFADLVARLRPDIVVADALGSAMFDLRYPSSTIIYRAEMIAQTHPQPIVSDASRIASKAGRSLVTGVSHSRYLEELAKSLGAEVFLAPCMWRSTAVRELHRHSRSREANIVGVLDAGRLAGAEFVCELLVGMGCRPVWVGLKAAISQPLEAVRNVSVPHFTDELFATTRPLPHFAIDISFGVPGLQLPRELLQRLHVPIITVEHRSDQPSITGPPPAGRVYTTLGLFQEIRSAMARAPGDPGETARRTADELDSDAGWVRLRNYIALSRSGKAS